MRVSVVSVFLLFALFSGCGEAYDVDIEGDVDGECSDSEDNDSDELFDCDDPDCETSAECEETVADIDTDSDADADTDTDHESPPPHGTVGGVLLTGAWTGDRDVVSLTDVWDVSGVQFRCGGCLYRFETEFDGQQTGDSFAREIVIASIPGYPGCGYVYSDTEMWGIAFDCDDYVLTASCGLCLYAGSSMASSLYQSYWYFYE